MENAAEALEMAAAFLMFIIALTISINTFGELRVTSRTLVENLDREYEYSYVLENNGTQRIVGAETIIPTIYKAYKENYKILFVDFPLYTKVQNTNTGATERIDIYSIDLEKETVGDNGERPFLEALLFGTFNDNIISEAQFKRANIVFDKGKLYDKIKGQKFKESLGIYYQEEQRGETGTPNANKTEKRVITYEKIIT